MILAPASDLHADAPTLDDLFRAATAVHPGATALVDPADRAAWDATAPRRLTYREADRVVTAIAVRLRALGLPTDSVIAFQLPNTVEWILTLLGILRAGYIAAPMPVLWRRADATAALARVAPRALVCGGESDDIMHIAAEIFSVRFVCAYGADVPDGVVPLDDVFTQLPDQPTFPRRDERPEDHVAVVTFDVGAEGPIAVARNHRQLLAAADLLSETVGHPPGQKMLMTLSLASFSAIATAVCGWLLSGGTLVLHHIFDPQTLRAQIAQETCEALVVPGALVDRLLGAALLPKELPRLIGIWRAPERLHQSTLATPRPLSEIAAFGEIACVPVTRAADGHAAPLLSHGPDLQLGRTKSGTLAIAGSLIPLGRFPAGSERRGEPLWPMTETQQVDTSYPCRIDRDSGGLLLDGPPPGVVAVGGCRFRLRDFQDLTARLDNGTHVTVLPDALSGHRLAGVAGAHQSMPATLEALGVHPLLVNAFRERRPESRSAA